MENTEQIGMMSSGVVAQKLQEIGQKKADLRKQQQEIARDNFDGKRGRPKGCKGKLTLLREAVLAKSENLVLNEWEEVVKVTLDLAKKGDTKCLNILWNRVLPNVKAVDHDTGKNDKLNITINVGSLEVEAQVEGEQDVVEAEFEEVNG